MLCPLVVFPSRKTFVKNILPSLVEKTMTTYVEFALVNYLLTTCTFDLWMSNGVHDVFVVVVNFISSDWET
jgi:hypothetical protein